MQLRSRRAWPRLFYVGVGLMVVALGLFLYGPPFDILKTRWGFPHLDSPTDLEGVVGRVIDGDTIELINGVRIRYIGVDTPELRRRIHGNWVYRPQQLAEDAMVFNQHLVEGKRVRLEYDEERTDHYHRELAYVFVGDLFVNAELIRSGYARVFLLPPNLKYSSLFLKLQEQAKDQQKGIWSPGHRPWRPPAGSNSLHPLSQPGRSMT